MVTFLWFSVLGGTAIWTEMFGGGGLIAGCAVAMKARNSKLRIVGVEAASYATMNAAINGTTVNQFNWMEDLVIIPMNALEL